MARRSADIYHRNPLIEKTESTEWGTDPVVASARALLEPTVTAANERLFRTHHPSLKIALCVKIVHDGYSKFWVADFVLGSADHLTAGNLQIHVLPRPHAPEHACILQPRIMNYHDTCPRIHPREMLTKLQVERIRDMFPSSSGVEVWIGGRIILLYEDKDSLDRGHSRECPPPSLVGGLMAGYKILDIEPSRQPFPLRLEFPDGLSRLASVTHAFVHRPDPTSFFTKMMAVIDGWLLQAIRTLKSWWKQTPVNAPAVMKSSAGLGSNSPLGKRAAIDGMKKPGTVTETYDEPSWFIPFPKGYKADLCLITVDKDQLLTEIAPPAGQSITGWGSVEKSLQDSPLFISTDDMDMTHVEETQKDALVEGTMYMWDEELPLGATTSLLWRTESDRTERRFGSLLCQKDQEDGTNKALVFQNFERKLDWYRPYDTATTIEGGFILPPEILKTRIQALAFIDEEGAHLKTVP